MSYFVRGDFKIKYDVILKDNKGNERELKGGLSEGERQLISLAFFFAINENLQDKQNKILSMIYSFTPL